MTCEPCDSGCPSNYPTSHPPSRLEDRRVHFYSMTISLYMFSLHAILILPFLYIFLASVPSTLSLALFSYLPSIIVITNHLWCKYYMSSITLSSLHLLIYLILTIPYEMGTINTSSLQVKTLRHRRLEVIYPKSGGSRIWLSVSLDLTTVFTHCKAEGD